MEPSGHPYLSAAGAPAAPSKDPAAAPLRAWAERIALRRGRSIAAVAPARRLAGILYAMWRDRKDYREGPGPQAARQQKEGKPDQ